MRIHNVSTPMATRPAMATSGSPLVQPAITFGEEGPQQSGRLKSFLFKAGLVVGGTSPIAMNIKLATLEALAAIGGPAAIGVAIGLGIVSRKKKDGE